MATNPYLIEAVYLCNPLSINGPHVQLDITLFCIILVKNNFIGQCTHDYIRVVRYYSSPLLSLVTVVTGNSDGSFSLLSGMIPM